MKIKVKILTVDTSTPEKQKQSEKELEEYITNSWQIISSSGLPDNKLHVILEKDIIEVSG